MKRGKISEKIFHSFRTTGSQSGRLYGLATELDEDELALSVHVINLYTNVLIEEAIVIALTERYSSDEDPEILRSIMKSLLRLAVTNVHFKCNKMW